LTTVRERPS